MSLTSILVGRIVPPLGDNHLLLSQAALFAVAALRAGSIRFEAERPSVAPLSNKSNKACLELHRAFSTGIVCYLALLAGRIQFETRATFGRPGFEQPAGAKRQVQTG